MKRKIASIATMHNDVLHGVNVYFRYIDKDYQLILTNDDVENPCSSVIYDCHDEALLAANKMLMDSMCLGGEAA